ncbi:MAG: hypothetical protein M9939_17945 [Mesorhizobium sp.]|nr:hypothetical protein [Mesorhizobium sp.]MCO5163021.1 hypothetical protein [Mesorhizobium sp.]
MRVFIECDDLVGVLSRTLDQTRRMGIEVGAVIADTGKASAGVELVVVDPPRSASHTFGKRISLIEGVSSVSIEDEPDPHLRRRGRVVLPKTECRTEQEG